MKRIFVDVREAEEYAKSHVKGAINIPPQQIMDGAKELAEFDKDTEIILYCISGSRSNVSMGILKALGFKNVINGINQQQVNAKYFKDK